VNITKDRLDYAKAKAKYETLKSQAIQTPDILDTNEYFDVFDNYLHAEQILILNTQELLKTKRPTDYAEVKDAFETRIYTRVLKEKLADLCFRLDVSTV